ncbi:hypothetical protein [Streptomyces bugieae]|uniref:Lipoprotein n=1 Tax=Streptomyces bugieae TaxID=3098223 RepID=A0ABU7NP08_9ACTN|nr:hypothetical protein [Streptomyces sp. DSM 41528]
MAAGLVGCTSAQPTGPPVSAAMTDVATRSGRWPTGADQLQAAFDQLDRTCLSKAGFHLPAAPKVTLPSPENEAATIDLAARRRRGYGISMAHDSSAAAGNPNAYASSLSAEDRQRFGSAQFGPGMPRTGVALKGKATATVPTAGCVARARTALAGDVHTWAEVSYIPQQFDDQTSRKALTDTGYRAALVRWRACMAQAGYTYASPDAAVARLQLEHERGAKGARFQRLERAVAVSDGECASRTHLPAELLRARRRQVSRLSARDLSTLQSVTQDWESAVTRARRVLAAPAKRGA